MCSSIYCQDGVKVFFGTETQGNPNDRLYGHYALESNSVNDRPYFRMDNTAIWWDNIGKWMIGDTTHLGQSVGWAYYTKDVFCPYQLSEMNWAIHDQTAWYNAENYLVITCKCIFIQRTNRV